MAVSSKVKKAEPMQKVMHSNRVIEAENRIRHREQAVKSAQAARDAIVARWESGIDINEAGDYSTADAEVVRATALLIAARAALQPVIERESKRDQSPTLARALARHLQTNAIALGLRGVSISYVDHLPVDAPESLPALYVAQFDLADRGADGRESGKVMLASIDGEDDPLDLREIVGSLSGLLTADQASGEPLVREIRPTHFGPGETRPEPGATTKQLRLLIAGAEPDLPTLTSPGHQSFGYTERLDRVLIGSLISHLDVRASSASVAEETTDADGTTHTTLAYAVSAVLVNPRTKENLPAEGGDFKDIAEAARRLVGARSGRFTPYGRVMSAEVTNDKPTKFGVRLEVRETLAWRKG